MKDYLLKNAETVNGITLIRFIQEFPADAIKNIAFQLRGQITEKLLFVTVTIEKEKQLLILLKKDLKAIKILLLKLIIKG